MDAIPEQYILNYFQNGVDSGIYYRREKNLLVVISCLKIQNLSKHYDKLILLDILLRQY